MRRLNLALVSPACAPAVFALALVSLSGCAIVQVFGEPMPGAQPAKFQHFYVERPIHDQRGLHEPVAKALTELGFQASAGEVGEAPPEADAIVTFVDRWFWDMRMYLLQFEIYVKDRRTGYVVGSGHSFRTSLAAKDAQGMSKEVLAGIFGRSQQ